MRPKNPPKHELIRPPIRPNSSHSYKQVITQFLKDIKVETFQEIGPYFYFFPLNYAFADYFRKINLLASRGKITQFSFKSNDLESVTFQTYGQINKTFTYYFDFKFNQPHYYEDTQNRENKRSLTILFNQEVEQIKDELTSWLVSKPSRDYLNKEGIIDWSHFESRITFRFSPDRYYDFDLETGYLIQSMPKYVRDHRFHDYIDVRGWIRLLNFIGNINCDYRDQQGLNRLECSPAQILSLLDKSLKSHIRKGLILCSPRLKMRRFHFEFKHANMGRINHLFMEPELAEINFSRFFQAYSVDLILGECTRIQDFEKLFNLFSQYLNYRYFTSQYLTMILN